jgi:hypothetical protein
MIKHRDCECMCHREGGWIHVTDCCEQARASGAANVVIKSAPRVRTLANNIEENFTLLRIPRA